MKLTSVGQKEPLLGSDHKYTLMEEEEDAGDKNHMLSYPSSTLWCRDSEWPLAREGTSVWFQPYRQSISLLSLTLHFNLNVFPLTYFWEGDEQVTDEMMKIVISRGEWVSQCRQWVREEQWKSCSMLTVHVHMHVLILQNWVNPWATSKHLTWSRRSGGWCIWRITEENLKIPMMRMLF